MIVNLFLYVVAVISSLIIGGGIAFVIMGIDDVVFIKNRYRNRVFSMETMDALRDADAGRTFKAKNVDEMFRDL